LKDSHEFLREIRDLGQHRPSARAIIFDSTRSRILIEWNHNESDEYGNFPGGGLEVGEALSECLVRELKEEVGATVVDFEFLFLHENYILFEGEYLHGLELYCELKLNSDEIRQQPDENEFLWVELERLGHIDIRPVQVRDLIVDGTYRDVRYLVSKE
jgi:8-oxo-dGTP pyrophosphatase MutT (NUDIX family)